jgi:hypothetical protein
MGKMKAFASAALKLTALTSILIPAVAHAGYVNDRRGWLTLTPEARSGYVQALSDSLNYVFSDDTLPNALAKKGRHKCLADQRTTSAILADRITTFYKDDRLSTLAPTAMYIIKMQETCRSYINAERANFGLSPI